MKTKGKKKGSKDERNLVAKIYRLMRSLGRTRLKIAKSLYALGIKSDRCPVAALMIQRFHLAPTFSVHEYHFSFDWKKEPHHLPLEAWGWRTPRAIWLFVRDFNDGHYPLLKETVYPWQQKFIDEGNAWHLPHYRRPYSS
jgi:hypothetical protein